MAPQRCAELRSHLQREREGGILFDTPRFVRALEAQFEQLAASAA
jgi:predicted O-linked N-acetylglucosamine transferase (SPINDLY family)